jgi:hypothetical protein
MDAMKSLCLLLVPMLIGLAEGACSSSCSCPNSEIAFHFPAELNVQLAAAGAACPSAPFCEVHGDGGVCTQYNVAITNAGACHLTATAVDGRQVSADLSARVSLADTCCGTLYELDSNVPVLTFDQDASTSG